MNSDTYKDKEQTENAPETEGKIGAGNGQESADNGAEAIDPSAELRTKLQDSEKKYLYLYSEFENFRRRAERERLDFIKFGHETFLRDVLQVLDNFERALEHAKSLATEKNSPVSQVSQGIEMIHYQLLESLRAQGVTEINAVGAKFDPALHEAVSEEESNSKDAGTVLKVAQKGYQLHGRLLRAARVVVVKAK